MLLMAFAMAAIAQNKKMKIAVMDFKAGVGVNANEVYNQYCSKPTASLSFGPATTGLGVGVYLNF